MKTIINGMSVNKMHGKGFSQWLRADGAKDGETNVTANQEEKRLSPIFKTTAIVKLASSPERGYC